MEWSHRYWNWYSRSSDCQSTSLGIDIKPRTDQKGTGKLAGKVCTVGLDRHGHQNQNTNQKPLSDISVAVVESHLKLITGYSSNCHFQLWCFSLVILLMLCITVALLDLSIIIIVSNVYRNLNKRWRTSQNIHFVVYTLQVKAVEVHKMLEMIHIAIFTG